MRTRDWLRVPLLALVAALAILTVGAGACGSAHHQVAADRFAGYWWLVDPQRDPYGHAPYVMYLTSSGETYALVADGVASEKPATVANGTLHLVTRQLVSGPGMPVDYATHPVTLSKAQGDHLTAAWYEDGSGAPALPLTYRRVSMAEGALRERFLLVVRGIQNWSLNNNDSYPGLPYVRPAESGKDRLHWVGSYMPPWPTNPITGEPMHAGRAPGDFEYRLTEQGDLFRFVGYGADGKPLVVF